MNKLNLKDEIKIINKINEIVYDNFNNYSLNSLHHILSFMVDDVIELIDKNEYLDDEIIEIYYDEFKDILKKNIMNRYNLFNKIPIYKDDELINIISINNFKYNFKEDHHNLIQYNSIMNLLNNFQEYIYEYESNIFNDKLISDEININDLYKLPFYNINKINNDEYEYKFYLISEYDNYICSTTINKFKLLDLFYKYIDLIIENITKELINDLKYY